MLLICLAAELWELPLGPRPLKQTLHPKNVRKGQAENLGMPGVQSPTGRCWSCLKGRDSPRMVPRGTAGSLLLGLLVRWQLPHPRSQMSCQRDVKFALANAGFGQWESMEPSTLR